VIATAHQLGLKVHLERRAAMERGGRRGTNGEGARRGLHSVSVCLSKGSARPVGRFVARIARLSRRVHRYRKVLYGGGCARSGCSRPQDSTRSSITASRLHDDHANAKVARRGPRRHAEPRRPMRRRSRQTSWRSISSVAPRKPVLELAAKEGVLFCTHRHPHRVRGGDALDVDSPASSAHEGIAEIASKL